jgi:hypothetical protein
MTEQSVKHSLLDHPFFKDRLNLVFILIHLGLNITQWVVLYFCLRDFRDYPIPLHYTVLGGVDIVGEWYRLFVLPLAALIIGIVNIVLAAFAYKREKLLSYFFVGLGTLLQALIFIVTLAFIKLVRG